MFSMQYKQSLALGNETLVDQGETFTGRTLVSIDEVIPANGAGANAVTASIPTAGLKAVFILGDVPCTITFTGSSYAPTIVANQMSYTRTLSADVTAVSIGANTVSSGPAGSVKIRCLYDS